MSYIDNNLLKNENVLYRTQLHWIIYIWPAIFTAIVVFFAQENLQTPFNKLIELGGFLYSIWLWLCALIQYYTSEFAITNQRVLIKFGWITITSFETLLTKIESIQAHQSLL